MQEQLKTLISGHLQPLHDFEAATLSTLNYSRDPIYIICYGVVLLGVIFIKYSGNSAP